MKLRRDQALELFEVGFETVPDEIAPGVFEATVAPMTIDQARDEVKGYLSFMVEGEVEETSITFAPDVVEETNTEATIITVRT